MSGVIKIGKNGFWEKRHLPNESLRIAAGLFNTIEGETIVEIGTGIHGDDSGNSVLVWANNTNATNIIAVDPCPDRIAEVDHHTREHSQVKSVLMYGVDYLVEHQSGIDLLYLDFWADSPMGRAEAYRECYLAVKDKMTDNSMILIDDTDHIHPWKHTFIVPLAQDDGYQILYEGRQTLLLRGDGRNLL